MAGSNLVQKERQGVRSKQVNVNATFWQCQVESSSSILLGQNYICVVHLLIILESIKRTNCIGISEEHSKRLSVKYYYFRRNVHCHN